MLVGGIALVGLAVPAHADDGVDASFLATLKEAGITYTNGPQAVHAARTACQMMEDGQAGIDVVKHVTEQNPGFTISGAAKFIAIAASAYCPQQLKGAGSGG